MSDLYPCLQGSSPQKSDFGKAAMELGTLDLAHWQKANEQLEVLHRRHQGFLDMNHELGLEGYTVFERHKDAKQVAKK